MSELPEGGEKKKGRGNNVGRKQAKIKHKKKKRRSKTWSSGHGAVETNPTRNQGVVSSIPGPAQWVKDLDLP